MSADKPLLDIRELSVTYTSSNPAVTAVSDLSLQIRKEKARYYRRIRLWKIHPGSVHHEAAERCADRR